MSLLPIRFAFIFFVSLTLQAAPSSEQNLNAVEFDQKVGGSIPEGLHFKNSMGEDITLSSLSEEKPLVLVMSWFACPNLCPMLLDNLAETARKLPFDNDEFNVASISIDPDETLATSKDFARQLQQKYGATVRDWSFMTGDSKAIETLTNAVGFHYAYDSERDSYAHPAGFVVISPGGIINRYLFGIEPNAPDLKLALLDAAKGKIGSPVDQIVLRCYRFDADSGQYNLAVMRLLQGAGGTFIIALIVLVWWMRRPDARN